MANLTPEEFKRRIVEKYPNGVASDGIRYADMNATDLTQRMVNKYPNGTTNDGFKYSQFLPKKETFLQKLDRKGIQDTGSAVAGFIEGVGSVFKGTQTLGDLLASKKLKNETTRATAEMEKSNKLLEERIAQNKAAGKDTSKLEAVLASNRKTQSDLMGDTTIRTENGLGDKISNKFTKVADKALEKSGVDKKNMTFEQNLFYGAGNTASYFIPALGAARVTKFLGAAGKIAAFSEGATMTMLEASQEAENVYKTNLEQGMSKEEASKRSTNDFLANVVLLGITNRFGLANPEIVKGAKQALLSVAKSIGSEGLQEGLQQVVSNISTNRPIMEGVKESAVIGGIIGGVFKGTEHAFNWNTTIKNPIEDTNTTRRSMLAGKENENVNSNANITETTQNPEVNSGLTSLELQKQIESGRFEPIQNITQDQPSTQTTIPNATNEGQKLDLAIKNEGLKFNSTGDTLNFESQPITQSQDINEAADKIIEIMNNEKPLHITFPQYDQHTREVIKNIEEKTGAVYENGVLQVSRNFYNDNQNDKYINAAKGEVQYYLDDAQAGRRVFIPQQDTMDYKVVAAHSTFPGWVPEQLRSRKLFDIVNKHIKEGTLPKEKNTRQVQLYSTIQEYIHNRARELRNKDINNKPAEYKDDGYDFLASRIMGREDFVRDEIMPKVVRGMEGIQDYINSLDISKKDKKHLEFVFSSIQPELLSTIGFSLQNNGKVQGSYSYGKKLITLYSNVIQKGPGEFSYAFVHEMWHGLSAYLSDSDKVALQNQFLKDKAKYELENPWFKDIVNNEDGITEDQYLKFVRQYPEKAENWKWNATTEKYTPLYDPENYRYKNEDEYFAERLTEKTFQKRSDSIQDKRANDIISWLRNILRKLSRRLEEFYNKDVVDMIANRFFDSKQDFIVRNDNTPRVRDLSFLDTTKKKNIFYGFNDISTRLLQKLAGKSSVSKQFIEDLAKSPDLKQVERDLINDTLKGYEGDVDVKTFAEEVKAQILPLSQKIITSDKQKYEYVVLSDLERGNIDEYSEVIYESPVKTTAGNVHFASLELGNYFGHVRREDLTDRKTRRVIEVQSDLFQKGRLEQQKYEEGQYDKLAEGKPLVIGSTPSGYFVNYGNEVLSPFYKTRKEAELKLKEIISNRDKELSGLEKYRNTWWNRMVREEVKAAATAGKNSLLFPVGETAMKIEGLGQETSFVGEDGQLLDEVNTKVGQEISYQGDIMNGDPNAQLIITKVLGDGKFKAVFIDQLSNHEFNTIKENKIQEDEYVSKRLSYLEETFSYKNAFDIEDPIYKFYEKDVASYLKNKYNATLYTDENGIKWTKVNITESIKNDPVEAFLEEQIGVKKAIEFPELVGLANELLGDTPIITTFRNKVNTKLGVFISNGQDNGKIKLAGSIFADPDRLTMSRVLAHEIGHLIDYLPNKSLSRGNIIGRLMTLQNFRASFLEGNERSVLHTELYDLSKMWNPFDETTASKEFRSYRKSSKEIYADFISVLFNDPQLAQRIAPASYDLFFKELDKKPEVRDAYFELQAQLRNRPDILERRLKSVYEMFDKADITSKQRQEMNRLADEEKRGLFFKLKFQFMDRGAAIAEKVKQAQKAGVKIEDSKNPIFSLEEDDYLSGMVSAEIRERFDSIVKDIERRGMNIQDLGAVLVFDRITKGDRQDVANPLGLQPEFVKEIYDDVGQVEEGSAEAEENKASMKSKLGNENFEYLQSKAQEFRNALKGVYKMGAEKGLYDQSAVDLFDSNEFYIPFRPIKYSDQKSSFRLKKQKGTLSEIENPVITAIYKAVSIIETAERNNIKLNTINFFKDIFPAEIEESETSFANGFMLPMEPKEKTKGLVRVYEEGKLKGYYVDKYVAEAFDRSNVGTQNLALSALRAMNNPFRGLFITFNLGFQTFNIIRDFQRFWKNIPGMTIPKAIKLYFKAMPVAKARAFGLSKNPSEREMRAFKFFEQLEKDKILSRSFSQMVADNIDETQYQTAMKSLGLSKDLENSKYSKMVGIKQLMKVMDFVENVGTYFETLPKVAGVYALEGKMAPKEMASHVRKYVGSPNFLAKGTQTPWSNQLFMFSNAIIQGLRSDIQIATDPKTATGYWYKTAMTNIVPKMFAMAALAGLFGDDLKKLFGKISEYDKTNYNIIPLGINQDGKAVYVRIPQDETGRFIGGMFWKIATSVQDPKKLLEGTTYTQLLDYTGGQLPSLSPVISSAVNVYQYMTGQNPYDTFRGRNVLTDDEFAAGGWKANKKFLSFMFEKMGGGVFMKLYTNESVPSKKDVVEKVISAPILSNILGRWIKVSDYGESEQLRGVKNDINKENAIRRLDDKEMIYDAVKEYQKDPIRKDEIITALFEKRFPNGRTPENRTKYDAFKEKAKVAFLRGEADPGLEALLYATSNEEKVSLLKKLKDNMSSSEYDNLLQFAQDNKVISQDVVNTINAANEPGWYGTN